MEAKAAYGDVSDAQNAREAAIRTHAALQDLARTLGYNPEHVYLRNPEVSPKYGHGNCWTVVWAGLYDWTIALTGGESACSRDLGRFGGEPEVAGLYDADNFRAEPFDGCVLQFYD
jgi:hypothetical protein